MTTIESNMDCSGVGILHNKQIIIKELNRSTDGRYLKVHISEPYDYIVSLLYFPASNANQRKFQFIKSITKQCLSSDIILGDFNWNYPERKETKQINKAMLDLIGPKLDIAANFIDENCKQNTFKKGKWTISRLDRIYAEKHCEIKFQLNLNFPEGKESHCPVQFKIGNAHSRRNWKMHLGTWLNSSRQRNLRETMPRPEKDDLGYTRYDNYIKQVKEFIQKEEKRIKKKYRKLFFKAKALLEHIPHNNEKKRKLVNVLKKLQKEKEMKIRLLAGKKWDATKELPSYFLSRMLKQMNNATRINKIKHPKTDEYVTEQREILDAFKCFYENLYSKTEIDSSKLREFLKIWNPPKLSTKEKQDLNNSFSMEELDVVLSSLKNFKAPGNDGMPSFPFKVLPDEGKTLLLAQINQFLNGCDIPASWKQGNIIAIHKKDDITDIANYRPISLLKTDYKIVSKLVTNRLNVIIPKLIHKDQIGFVKERIIYDNVLTLNEILQEDKKFCLSIDFQKAYDSVSHDALCEILKHIAIPERLRKLIEHMLSESTAAFSMEGEISDPFKIEKGVKQGDPLSPLLFDLAIEPLANFIRSKCNGMKIGNTEYKILLYADDIVLVADSHKEQLEQLKIMEEYGKATGLKMNLKKSFHISSHSLEMAIPSCPTNGFKYLGFMINHNGLMDMKESIIDRIRKAINQWKHTSNRMLCKAAIINGYIMSKLWYYSFILDFDDQIEIETLEKLQKSFLTAVHDKEYTTRTKMRLERVQRPLKVNGLGIFDLKTRFKAQRAWIIEFALNSDSKIGTIWKEKYNLSSSLYSNPAINSPKLLSKSWNDYKESWNMIPNIKRQGIPVRVDSLVAWDGMENQLDNDADCLKIYLKDDHQIPVIHESYTYDRYVDPRKIVLPAHPCDFIPLKSKQSKSKPKSNGNKKKKRKKKKSKLKKITHRFTGTLEPVYTPRQIEWKKDKGISLVDGFIKLKRIINNVKVLNLLWHFINGVCYYNRKENCRRCGEENSHRHIFFDCRKVKNSIQQLIREFSLNQDFIWDQYSCWYQLIVSNDEVYFSILIAGMYSAWECRHSVFKREESFIKNLEQLMISRWYCALYDVNALKKKISPVQSFYANWEHLINKSENIPTIIKQRKKPQQDNTPPRLLSPLNLYARFEQIKRSSC